MSSPPGSITPFARRLDHAPDSVELLAALGAGPHGFIIESADPTGRRLEHSVVGLRSALHLTADRTTATVAALTPNGEAALDWLATTEPDGERIGRTLRVGFGTPRPRHRASTRPPSPLDLIRRLVSGPTVAPRPSPWCHLAAGLFGYDVIDYFATLPPGGADPLEQPILEWWIPEALAVVDHRRGHTTVIASAWGGAEAAPRVHDAVRTVAGLARLVMSIPQAEPFGPAPRSTVDPEVEADLSDAGYAEVVRRLQRHLHAGDVYQIVPARTFSTDCPDPLEAYRHLRAREPGAHLFYFAGASRTIFGSSPERCLSVNGASREVSITPIAGTAPRGRGPDGQLDSETDARHEAALRQNPKELAEHMMLVDLARNDVARVSEPGTRSVRRLLAVERFAEVMHLVSEVTGILRSDLDALDAYAATANMGTLVGVPKLRAAELLRDAEPRRRGAYGGAAGYLRFDGSLDTAIVIRSAVVQRGQAHVTAGAGVVLDSDPDGEARETRHKARAVLGAIATARAAVEEAIGA
ncbi:MAG: anthranilate synthase component 1 [Gemmatimonadetes bacterium]|nr:anthranilate synthase component 1 [Gemmatimonadota bacterium]